MQILKLPTTSDSCQQTDSNMYINYISDVFYNEL